MHFEEQHRPASAVICMHGCSSACVTLGFCIAALLLLSCLIAFGLDDLGFCVPMCVAVCVCAARVWFDRHWIVHTVLTHLCH